MRKLIIAAFVGIFILCASGIVSANKNKTYYVCNCKDDCKCSSLSERPGKCKCGSELVAMHLLEVEKDIAVLCGCGEKCSCGRSKDDPDKCTCGKPVKKTGLNGVHVCNCNGNRKCNATSGSARKCGCRHEKKDAI